MHFIDWSIIILVLLFLVVTSLYTRKYSRSVADFLAANRCAKKYLLGTASATAGQGAISIIAFFESFYRAGWPPIFWAVVQIPITTFVALSGFVVYRYRQTRALTMAQFYEMRYSRKFRIFAGIIAWIAGLINFGFFPGVGSRFLVYYCNLPLWNYTFNIPLAGPVEISLMLALVMAILLGLALFFTFMGGQIAVIVTDFWQGCITLIIFILIAGFLWYKLPWHVMCESFKLASTPEFSFINPFDILSAQDFNMWFVAINAFFILYTCNARAWHGSQGYDCAALNAHEAKMSGIVGQVRRKMIDPGLIFIGISTIVIMHHPNYAHIGQAVSQRLNLVFSDNPFLQSQMRIPMTMAAILPVGLVGAFAVAILGFFLSTHNTYMHSWGAILIQDVILPMRKNKTISPEKHIKYLKMSILFVAVFIYFFGLLFPPRDYIYMIFAITGAIYVGGAGSVILGGLYWKRGTTKGAWAAMITGSVLSVSAITAQYVWPRIPETITRIYSIQQNCDIILTGEIQIYPELNKLDPDTTAYLIEDTKILNMVDFEIGAKALEPLPEARYKTLRDGREALSGPLPTEISQIAIDPNAARQFTVKAKITKTIGNGYFLISDNSCTIIAKIIPGFPINGLVMTFWCAIAGMSCYVIVSLLTKPDDIDFDKIFHRGKYAVKEETVSEDKIDKKPIGRFWRMIGVNSHEFSKADKLLFLYTAVSLVCSIGGFIVMVLLHFAGLMNTSRWLIWYSISTFMSIIVCIVGAIWIHIFGGLSNLREMFRLLATRKRDDLDDGTVVGHTFATDLTEEEKQKLLDKDSD